MENIGNPMCEDCGRQLRMRPFNLFYAWFCGYCNRFDIRTEIVVTVEPLQEVHNFTIIKDAGRSGKPYNLFLQSNSHFF